MRLLITGAVLASLAALGHSAAAGAGRTGTIELRATAETEMRIVNEKGEAEIIRVEATKVVPGDVVIYTIHCTNVGSEAAENVTVTNPVPDHMVYMDATAQGFDAAITFSVDGGESYDAPGNLTVVDHDGRERPAVASEYTHIRWELRTPLAPQEGRHVSFRARLS